MSSFIPPLPPTFEAALRDVEARHGEFRLAAAKRLGDATPEQLDLASEALERLATDEMGPVRAAALTAMADLALPRFLETATRLLDDPHSGVRHDAGLALGCIGTPEARARLVERTRDERDDIRFIATFSLAIPANPEDAEHVIPRLGDPDPEVRGAAAQTLGEMDARFAIDDVAPLLEDPDSEVWTNAALALGMLGDARAVPRLRQMLAMRSHRLSAIFELGELGAVEAREDLAAITERFFGDLNIKAAAAGALHQTGDPRGVPALRKVFRAFRPDGRDWAVKMTGDLRIVDLADELAALVRRPRRSDPVVLAKALGQLAPESEVARDALERLKEQRGRRGEAVRQALSIAAEEPT